MSTKKKKFSPQEHTLIIEHAAKNGECNWDGVVESRTGREYRERYKKCMGKPVKKDEWTQEELILIEEKVKEYGPRWAKIAQFFKGRTALSLKNRWNYKFRRLCIQKEDYLQCQSFYLNMPYLQDTQLPIDFEFIRKASENFDLNESTAQHIIVESRSTYQKTDDLLRKRIEHPKSQGSINDTNQEPPDQAFLDGDIEKLDEIIFGH